MSLGGWCATRGLVLALCAWGACVASAEAQRVVVFDIDGPGGARARVSAVRVLRDHDVAIEPREQALAALDGTGADEHALDAEALVRIAQGRNVDGFVIGTARTDGRRVVVTLRVVDRRGEDVGSATFEARNAADTGRAVRDGLWRELGVVIAALGSSEQAEPRADTEPHTQGDRAAAEATTGARRESTRGEATPSDGARTAAPGDASRGEAGRRGAGRREASGREGDGNEHEDGAATVASDDGDTTRRPRGDARTDAVEYYLQAGMVMRRLSFTDDLFDALGTYDLGAAVGLGAGGVYYPLRGFVDAPFAHLGVEWAFSRVMVDDTENQSGQRFDTRAWSWQTSLRYEAPVGARLLVWGAFGMGRERFQVEPAGPTMPGGPVESGVPSVRYTFLRLVAGLRVHLVAGLSVALYGGWRPVTDLGQLGNANWFPRARGNGIEAGGYAAYRLHRVFELRVIAEHRRYVADLQPRPGDPRVAGGSADTWLNLQLAAVVALPSAP